MLPPVLHFGYYDHAALAEGRFRDRRDPHADLLPAIVNELFGALPGRDMPGLGFFDYYGVLTCGLPSPLEKLPVDRLLELVDRSGCDVVYAYNGEFRLVARAWLAQLSDPERISSGSGKSS